MLSILEVVHSIVVSLPMLAGCLCHMQSQKLAGICSAPKPVGMYVYNSEPGWLRSCRVGHAAVLAAGLNVAGRREAGGKPCCSLGGWWHCADCNSAVASRPGYGAHRLFVYEGQFVVLLSVFTC